MLSPQGIPYSTYHKSLDVSWKEGIAATVMVAITDYYLIPLGLFLGAVPLQIGLLVAIPHLLASISQLLASRVVYFLGSRLRFLVQGSILQAALLIPVALLPITSFSQRIVLLIMLVIVFRILASLISTVWGSLVSDYLPAEERGKYFGWRSQISGVAGVLSTIAGGAILFSLKNTSLTLGFILVFVVAAAARFISANMMSEMRDVPIQRGANSDFTFVSFLTRTRKSNFVKFVLYVSSITFATYLASPYFSVYMLRDLKFNYLAYMSVQLASVVASLISFPIWGRHADVTGNARVLKLTSMLIPLIPLFWALTTKWPLLICTELFSGFVWGGFNLCSLNFIYDAVSPPKRVRCLSYFTLINGVGLFLGASTGGFLADHLPALAYYRLPTLFLLSAAMRFASHFLLSHRFQEVRTSAKKVSSLKLFFSVVGLKPLFGRDQEWAIFPLVKKPKWSEFPSAQEESEKT